MATAQRTITITTQQNAWIDAKVAAGGYTSDSEYIRELIRHDEARASEAEYLREELLKGELSGEPRPFDIDKFLKRKAASHAQTKG